MEMCVDNPREEFSDLFDTHPSVDKRIEALIKFAGGHDPGPLAIEPQQSSEEQSPPPGGPWGQSTQYGQQDTTSAPSTASPVGRPFLPDQPPVDLGGRSAPEPNPPGKNGPWGPHN